MADIPVPALYCESTGDRAQWRIPEGILPPGIQITVEGDPFPVSAGHWFNPRSHKKGIPG